MPLNRGGLPPVARLREALDHVPAGFTVTDLPGPGSYYGDGGAIALRNSAFTFDPASRTGAQSLYGDRIVALKTWAREHGVFIAMIGTVRAGVVRDGRSINAGGGFPSSWVVGRTAREVARFGQSVDLTTPDHATCVECGAEHPTAGTLICPTTGKFITCLACLSPNVRVHPQHGTPQWPAGDGAVHARDFLCAECGVPCGEPGCTSLVTHAWRYCDLHAQHGECGQCQRVVEWRNNVPGDGPTPHPILAGLVICERCEMMHCEVCNGFNRNVRHSDQYNRRACELCRRNLLIQTNETFDEGADLDLAAMITIPGRERIRMVGVEIEGANGTLNANGIAAEFYRQGFSTADVITQHNSGRNYGIVHVERDSSVDWEVVVGPLNMASVDDARILNAVMTTIRNAVRQKTLGLDMRCGVHIHVGAERVSIAQAYNLSHLFTYLEDPLFRIAAAKWPFHRAAQGSRYCAPTPKYTRKLEFMNNRGGVPENQDNHYYALSFQNYFDAKLRRCECGAVRAGIWDECTCRGLGKCTFEFRLFNTTANPKKMVAYLALSQALVAKAIGMSETRNPAVEFPGLEFNRRIFSEMEDDTKAELVEQWRPRLSYIFNELPLTDDERVAVRYCVQHSEIATGLSPAEIDELTTTRTTEEVAA